MTDEQPQPLFRRGIYTGRSASGHTSPVVSLEVIPRERSTRLTLGGGRSSAIRHEIDNSRRAGFGLELGFEDEGAGAISPSCGERRLLWSNEPPAIVDCSDQADKASGRIEPQPAQSID